MGCAVVLMGQGLSLYQKLDILRKNFLKLRIVIQYSFRIMEALATTECRITEALVVMECRIKEALVCRILEVLVAMERRIMVALAAEYIIKEAQAVVSVT